MEEPDVKGNGERQPVNGTVKAETDSALRKGGRAGDVVANPRIMNGLDGHHHDGILAHDVGVLDEPLDRRKAY